MIWQTLGLFSDGKLLIDANKISPVKRRDSLNRLNDSLNRVLRMRFQNTLLPDVSQAYLVPVVRVSFTPSQLHVTYISMHDPRPMIKDGLAQVGYDKSLRIVSPSTSAKSDEMMEKYFLGLLDDVTTRDFFESMLFVHAFYDSHDRVRASAQALLGMKEELGNTNWMAACELFARNPQVEWDKNVLRNIF